jgi:Tol biopolymer transport system component
MSANGASQTRLTNNSVQDLDPNASPDGKYILFSSQVGSNNTDIYQMNENGSNPVQLTNTAEQEENPDWQAITTQATPRVYLPLARRSP